MSEFHYLTGNAGKFEEVKAFVERNNPSLSLQQIDIDLDEIQTLDHVGVAIDKAKRAWQILKKPLLVDDAGIYFEKYHRFPGTLTKFVFQGIGFDGILKLVEGDHRAYFLIYLVYINGPESYQVFEGICHGKIVEPRVIRAHPSLPFDDIFVPQGTEKTYAELRHTPDLDIYNYRIMAFKKFLQWYNTQSQHGS